MTEDRVRLGGEGEHRALVRTAHGIGESPAGSLLDKVVWEAMRLLQPLSWLQEVNRRTFG
jgi:hypothetical protein